jgi:hypothetical protein
MASAIKSGHAAIVGLFDMATQTLDSGSMGMDILHTKVRVAHAAATDNIEEKLSIAMNQSRRNLAEGHAEFIIDQDDRLARNPKLLSKFNEVLQQLENGGVPTTKPKTASKAKAA